MTNSNTKCIRTPSGSNRTFVEDGDEVNFNAWGFKDNETQGVGFGDCKSLILPARF